MPICSDFQEIIPSNKFYPPHIDIDLSLYRPQIINEKLFLNERKKKIIVIEAQAGQGKTTTVYQFLHHSNHRYLWYQIGPEDADPVLLLNALLTNMMNKLKGFESPQLTRILNEGEIGPQDLKRCVNILLSDLDHFLAADLYFVFDDIHLIEQATLTNNLIDYIIDSSPPKLHFIFTSRHPLNLSNKTLRDGKDVFYLTNKDLALNSHEIEQLFNEVIGKSITSSEASTIHQKTNGWIMGIILAAHPMVKNQNNSRHDDGPISFSASFQQGNMLEYFHDEIFSQIPKTLHTSFLQLSFLDEIPVSLASHITENKAMASVLAGMSNNNFFVYSLDREHAVFRFHHLFQEYLQTEAKQKLSTRKISAIYDQAAIYYLDRGIIEKTLTCYLQACNYTAMEDILKQEGMKLMARNRTVTLFTMLQSIPERTLLAHAWLTLFAGLLYGDFAPEKTLPLLETARNKFILLKDETGELLANAQIIYFHFVVSGLFRTGAMLLPRTEKLLLGNIDSLPVHTRIMVARNLAAGYCFFNSNMDKAKEYGTMARELATKHRIRNFIASTRFILGYIQLLSGSIRHYLMEAEISYNLVNDPLVGMSNKLTLRVMHLAHLSMQGDFLNFRQQMHLLKSGIDTQIVQQTVAAPYLFVWSCACSISQGKIDEARTLIEQGTNISATAATEHMKSQLLQWKAYIHALDMEKEQALACIQEATALRGISGGPFYEAFQAIMAGATYTRIDMNKEAEAAFAAGISRAEILPSPYVTACGLIHRSYWKLKNRNKDAALDDLREGLRLMKENSYLHFWSWTPETMQELLALAVANKIEQDYARKLSQIRHSLNLADDGSAIPLLHITLLGNFSMWIDSKKTLTSEDFTPLQRELLGLLVSAKSQRISQEHIQLALWPDSSPDKARSTFDTLLSRIRKTIASSLDLTSKNYIVIRKGIVSLSNCRIDSVQFSQYAELGLSFARSEQWWQAGNAINQAIKLWNGCFLADSLASDQILEYCDTLHTTYTTIAHIWGVNLAETGRGEEAAALVSEALRWSPAEEKLVVFLYGLYVRSNQPAKTKEVLKRYANGLEQLHFDEEQIKEMVENIVSSCSK